MEGTICNRLSNNGKMGDVCLPLYQGKDTSFANYAPNKQRNLFNQDSNNSKCKLTRLVRQLSIKCLRNQKELDMISPKKILIQATDI